MCNPLPVTPETSARLKNMSILCALFVVGLHCKTVVVSHTFYWWWVEIFQQGIARLAVPFFFVASGYLLAGHTVDGGWYKRILLKRTKTLLIPFLIWLLLFNLLNVYTSWIALIVRNYLNGDPLLLHFPTTLFQLGSALGFNILNQPPNHTLWFLRTLCCFMLVSPLFVFVVKKGKMWALLFAGALFCGSFALYVFWFGLHLIADDSLFRWLFCNTGVLDLGAMAYFVSGIGLRYYPMRWSISPKMRRLLLLVALSVILFRPFIWVKGGVFPLIPLLLPVVFINIPTRLLPQQVVASSFPIYLMHLLIIGYFDWIMRLCSLNLLVKTTWLGNVLKISCVFVISGLVALLLRRAFPRFSQVVFGGR